VHVQVVRAQPRRHARHGSRRGGFVARPRHAELEGPEQADAAHVADVRARGGERRQPRPEPVAERGGVLDEPLVAQGLDRGDDRRAHQRVRVAGQAAPEHFVVEVARDAVGDDHRPPGA